MCKGSRSRAPEGGGARVTCVLEGVRTGMGESEGRRWWLVTCVLVTCVLVTYMLLVDIFFFVKYNNNVKKLKKKSSPCDHKISFFNLNTSLLGA